MRRIAIGLVMLGMVVGFSGCKKKNPLVGTWAQQSDDPSQGYHEIKIYEDGVYEDMLRGSDAIGGRLIVNGRWTLEGTKLTAKPTKVEFQNMTEEQRKKAMAKLPPEVRAPDIGTVEWVNDDSWVFTPASGDGAATYVRASMYKPPTKEKAPAKKK